MLQQEKKNKTKQKDKKTISIGKIVNQHIVGDQQS